MTAGCPAGRALAVGALRVLVAFVRFATVREFGVAGRFVAVVDAGLRVVRAGACTLELLRTVDALCAAGIRSRSPSTGSAEASLLADWMAAGVAPKRLPIEASASPLPT